MKRTIVAAIAALAITTTGPHADSTLPKAFQGEWCLSDTSTHAFARGKCTTAFGEAPSDSDNLAVRSRGFALPEYGCTLLSVTVAKERLHDAKFGHEYRAKFKCGGPGQDFTRAAKTSWITYFRIALYMPDLMLWTEEEGC